MEIKKAFRKDGVIQITYENNGTIFNIKSSASPKESFGEAMDKLKWILFRNLEVFTPNKVTSDYADNVAYKDVKREVARQERLRVVDHFKAVGLSHSFSEQNGDTYRILGVYKTSSGSNPISTCAMTEPESGDSFWMNGQNLPTEYPKFLTPEDMQAINEFMLQVEEFIKGEREQKELFTDDGDPTTDADNGSVDEEFTEEGEVADPETDDSEFSDFEQEPEF